MSLAIPAYNEADGLAERVRAWVQALRGMPDLASFELVICNDGSADATGPILDALAAELPEVRAVHHARNRGAGQALVTAIAQTQLEWVLLLDADGQFPVHNLQTLLQTARQTGARCVSGVRDKQDHWYPRLGSKWSGAVANWLHGSRLRDFNSICKLVDGPLLRDLPLEANGLSISTDLTSKLLERGVTMAEVDIVHLPRQTGRSSLRWARDAEHRLLYVAYAGLRQALIRRGVLRVEGK